MKHLGTATAFMIALALPSCAPVSEVPKEEPPESTQPSLERQQSKLRDFFARYQSQLGGFKAFAVDPSTGSWGSAWGRVELKRAVDRALRECWKWGRNCELYAVGNTIVFGMSHEQMETVAEEYAAAPADDLAAPADDLPASDYDLPAPASYLKDYRKEYRQLPGHKALAVSPDGPWGWGYGANSVEIVVHRALNNCQSNIKPNFRPCSIYDVDDAITIKILDKKRKQNIMPRQARTGADRFAANVLPVIESVQASGVASLLGIAGALNARGIKTASRGAWVAATVYSELIRYGTPFYERSLAIQEEDLEQDRTQVAQTLNRLGELYRAHGRYAEAEPLFMRALEIVENTYGPEHMQVARTLNNLGQLYRAQGAHATAGPYYQRALAILDTLESPDPIALAHILNNFAQLYHAQGKHAEAEALFKQALAIKHEALGPEHVSVATSLDNLAEFYRDQRRHSEAEPLQKRAHRIWEKALGPEHPDIVTNLENYAVVLRKAGRRAEATKIKARIEEIRAMHAGGPGTAGAS